MGSSSCGRPLLPARRGANRIATSRGAQLRIRILAVGTKLPRWAQDACGDYLSRLKGSLDLSLVELAPGRRSAAADPARALAQESAQFTALLGSKDYAAALDERGRQFGTRALATWLEARRSDGRDVALLIGGPDGLGEALRVRCQETLALSMLTLPHALARVVLIEQLYRAQTILVNHPYHRD